MGIFRQFPYSNFHDMNMDQIIKIMREMQDEWAATKTEWASYKDFIDNYFANLNVTDEVLNAMRVFATDGTLSNLIDPVIAEETAEWLAAHITVTTGETVIDNTLSIAGAAADAKATGDAFKYKGTNLKGYLDAFDYAMERLEGKYANYTNGIIGNANNYVCYHYIPVKPSEMYWLSTWRSPAHVCFYDHVGRYVGGEVHTENNTPDHMITIPANCYYLTVSYGEINMINQGEKRATLIPVNYYYNNHNIYDIDYDSKELYSAEIICNRNVLDRLGGYKNHYYKYNDGSLAPLANYYAIEIPAVPNARYCTLNPKMHIAFMNEAGTYISGVADDQALSFVTPTNCYSMRIGYRYQYDENTPHYIALCPKQTSGAVYSTFGSGDVYQIKAPLAKTLTVGSGQQFATITEAVQMAQDGDTILVYPGIYTENVKAYTKKINIVGVSKDLCILQYSANDYYNPALEIAKGSVKNMTIKAFWSGDTSIMRAYCVHIDNNNLRGETLSFDNVNFISERGATIGVGLRTNSYVIFNNCSFHATDSAVEGPVYVHDSEQETEGSGGYAVYENQNIRFINCAVINETSAYSIKLQSQERLDKCCNITFINNKIIQPNNSGKTVSMTLWEGRTLTNTNYLGSSDFVLTEISGCNSQAILDYPA